MLSNEVSVRFPSLSSATDPMISWTNNLSYPNFAVDPFHPPRGICLALTFCKNKGNLSLCLHVKLVRQFPAEKERSSHALATQKKGSMCLREAQ